VLCERNGTGRAVVGGLRRCGVPITSIWSRGGRGWGTDQDAFSVALLEMVHATLMVWSSRRLLFANLSESAIRILEEECRNYEHRLTAGGQSTYRSRAGTHDDVLRALCQAVAWCEVGVPDVRASKVIV
jgi:hypothetical protein